MTDPSPRATANPSDPSVPAVGRIDKLVQVLDVGLQSTEPLPGERPADQCWRCESLAANELGLCQGCQDALHDPETIADEPDDIYEVTMLDVFVPGVFLSQVTGGENPLAPDALDTGH